jgi:hypothetical protein
MKYTTEVESRGLPLYSGLGSCCAQASRGRSNRRIRAISIGQQTTLATRTAYESIWRSPFFRLVTGLAAGNRSSVTSIAIEAAYRR